MVKNNEKISYKEISRSIHQTRFFDGFAFIYIGLVLLVVALIINFKFSFGPVVVVIISEAFRPTVSEILRTRFTYPRIGYFKVKVEKSSQAFPRVLLFMAFVIIASILVILILEGGGIDNLYGNMWKYAPIIFGLIMFGPSIDLVNQTGQPKYFSIGFFSTILGILIFFVDFQTPQDGFVRYLLILGFLFIILGLVLFIRFIQSYPIITDDDDPVNKEPER